VASEDDGRARRFLVTGRGLACERHLRGEVARGRACIDIEEGSRRNADLDVAETLLKRTSPAASDSRRMSPETDFASAEPAIPRARRSPETVWTDTSPCTRSRSTSPLTLFTVAFSATSPLTCTSPDTEFTSSASSCPAICVSAEAVLTLTPAPCGTRASIRRPALPKTREPSENEMPILPLSRKLTTTRFPSWRTSTCSSSRSSPVTVTNVSSPSAVSTSMLPLGIETSSVSGMGVWKVCSIMLRLPGGSPCA
jgi:hypothetical protein